MSRASAGEPQKYLFAGAVHSGSRRKLCAAFFSSSLARGSAVLSLYFEGVRLGAEGFWVKGLM